MLVFLTFLTPKWYLVAILRELREHTLEAVAQRCSVKKVFLGISQDSQENNWSRVSFLQAEACNFIKK